MNHRLRGCATLILLTALAGLLGCGADGVAEPSTAADTGSLRVRIAWPEADARLIPAASQSVHLTLTPDGASTPAEELLLTRPETEGTLGYLPLGTAVLRATAHPEPDGSGVAQASASRTVTITGGVHPEVALSLASDIAVFTVTPETTTVAAGESVELHASATNADGATVLLPDSAAWAVVSGQEYITLASSRAASGYSARVTAVSAGEAVVQVTFEEAPSTPRTASAMVTVTAADDAGGLAANWYGWALATPAPLSYSAMASFDVDADGDVSGWIDWTEDRGAEAREHVEGTVDADGNFELVGTRLELGTTHPSVTFRLGRYTGSVSDDGVFCSGFWNSGRFLMTRSPAGPAFRLIGDAMIHGSGVRLANAGTWRSGAIWSRERLPVADGFSTDFSFQLSQLGGVNDPDGNNGADGFAFVVQDHSLRALGYEGGAIGYYGIPRSLAVEFDTYRNGEHGDPNGNHISVQTRGTSANTSNHGDSLGASTVSPRLENGQPRQARVTYAGGRLQVFVDDLMQPLLDVEVDLRTRLALADGRAWVGFTAATGSAYENHDILAIEEWSVTTSGSRAAMLQRPR